MTFWKLVTRTLFFYRRTNVSILLGTSLGTAIIVGALVVGDSVRHSLVRLTLVRLGRTEYALDSSERFFRAALADELSSVLDTATAPLMQLRGIAIRDGGRVRVNHVRILGVDGRFWTMWPHSVPFSKIDDDRAVVSEAFASRLGLEKGDEFLLRVEKKELLPRDAPLSSDKDTSAALRLTVDAIASDDQFGRFGLQANQVASLNVFVSLSQLSRSIDMPGRANTILAARGDARTLGLAEVNDTLRGSWKMADAGLRLRTLRDVGAIELVSDRVFVDPPVADAAMRAGKRGKGILTYFVNKFRSGQRTTPYSFVSAAGEPVVPSDMANDEIIVNTWLAEDLGVGRGDTVELTFYVLGPMRTLKEESASFRVRSSVSIDGAAADRDLMPSFPGFSSEIENCADWDPGIPIDTKRIRDKDEAYWDKYRGIPKAFVTLDAAQKMWGNRFGALTAVRYPVTEATPAALSDRLLKKLEPSSLGFVFSPVRQQGIEASTKGVDFAQLFMGLSFFIVVAAMLLTGLLFVFGVESRAEETEILLALGYPSSYVRRLMLVQGGLLALVGGVLGVVLGVIYDHAVLSALRTVWHGAIGTSALRLHLRASTIVLGALCGTGAALLPMWLASRRQARLSLRGSGAGADITARGRSPWPVLGLAVVFMIGAAAVVAGTGSTRGKEAAGAFFAAGALMLACGLSLSNILLTGMRREQDSVGLDVVRMGVRNLSRRRWRSLATVGLLSCGIFLVSAVAANRHDPLQDVHQRSSGTGGFALYGESSLPILRDLNTKEGRKLYGLEGEEWTDVEFVHLRIQEGEDASCLNLNRVQKPRILAVNPAEFAARGAFTFVIAGDGVDPGDPWAALARPAAEDGVVQAVADYSVITWGLGKSVGDTLSYVDERGRPFKVRLIGGLANSVFQGSILISEDAFIERFPSVAGSKALLVDAPFDRVDGLAGKLTDIMQDVGLEAAPSAQRLAEFNAVENTYLSIFLLLGGLGLVLGCAGMGVVLLRNILERCGELALLRAVGFSKHALQWMVLCEHWVLLALGLACGLTAALVAVLPAIASPGGDVPYASIAVLIAAVTASGAIWTYLATVLATRGDLLPALRGE